MKEKTRKVGAGKDVDRRKEDKASSQGKGQESTNLDSEGKTLSTVAKEGMAKKKRKRRARDASIQDDQNGSTNKLNRRMEETTDESSSMEIEGLHVDRRQKTGNEGNKMEQLTAAAEAGQQPRRET